MHELVVSLNGEIVQDGNYDDFSRGERHKFAIEFFVPKLASSVDRVKRCQHASGASYAVVGEVILSTPTVWAIDFGVKVFWESPPPEFAQVGEWVQGELGLGIDPFFYKEYLRMMPGMPDLFCEWNVARIQMCKGPWIEEVRGGRTFLMRDPRHITWVDKAVTDAWNDDEGRADYLFTLSR
ncbi:hypothetical protein [Trinickia fusca]|nr:hypothetical protein [Trinickia fusca]